jgi:hypothetical protein
MRCLLILALAGCATTPVAQHTPLPLEDAARAAIKTASSNGFSGCCAESAARDGEKWNVLLKCEERSLALVVDDQGNVIALR